MPPGLLEQENPVSWERGAKLCAGRQDDRTTRQQDRGPVVGSQWSCSRRGKPVAAAVSAAKKQAARLPPQEMLKKGARSREKEIHL